MPIIVSEQDGNLFLLVDGPLLTEGGDGDDTIVNDAGWPTTLSGGAGADWLQGDLYEDRLAGGPGADTLVGGGMPWLDVADYAADTAGVTVLLLDGAVGIGGLAEGDVYIGIGGAQGGSGNDVLMAPASIARLTGGSGDDTLVGGAFDQDRLVGQDGNDVLLGGDGYDILYGWDGNDTALGGAGNDEIGLDNGEDAASGEDGDDALRGGDGADALLGAAGRDSLFGDGGADALDGGSDADTLSGGTEDDNLWAGDGDDHLLGGDGDDGLEGGAGQDWLFGEDGEDGLDGGDGDDTLSGGLGADALAGGTRADVFLLDPPGTGLDRVLDFTGGEDRIALFAALLPGLAAGSLDAARFEANAAGEALLASAGTSVLVFDTFRQALLWDGDGSGGAAAIGIAFFDGAVALAASDITLI